MPTAASSGAKAGPDDSVAPMYNASDEARQAYYNWLNYEFQSHEDGNRPAEDLYTEGVVTCSSRRTGMSESMIVESLAQNKGYTRSAGAAIVKASLNALCPNMNRNYMTYFDTNVDKFYNAVVTQRRVTYSAQVPSVYYYGYYMKEVCAFMSTSVNAGQQVYDHFARAVRDDHTLTRGGVSETVLRIYLKHAVNSGCYGLLTQLPPVIQMVQ